MGINNGNVETGVKHKSEVGTEGYRKQEDTRQ